MTADIIIQIPVLLLSVIIHEIAHGLTAYKLGDSTAKDLNRLTLNPIPHIDLFWSIIIPALLIISGSGFIIGGAKPVPIDPRNFKNPKKGMMITALAGPLSNFGLAFISLIMLKIADIFISAPEGYSLITIKLIFSFFLINMVLGIFNLIPIPPLDGGRILIGLLPNNLAYSYSKIEPYGIFIVIGLLYFGVLGFVLAFVVNSILRFL